ncbi:MAG TPA: hypothetical protein PLJ22_05235, partial [Kiritimatiellia bacterium]|nr:hypothetical protein [Kiritimatiellia bacterium]
EILRMHVLRTADKARQGLTVAGLGEAGVRKKIPAVTARGYSQQPRLCRPELRRAVVSPEL